MIVYKIMSDKKISQLLLVSNVKHSEIKLFSSNKEVKLVINQLISMLIQILLLELKFKKIYQLEKQDKIIHLIYGHMIL